MTLQNLENQERNQAASPDQPRREAGASLDTEQTSDQPGVSGCRVPTESKDKAAKDWVDRVVRDWSAWTDELSPTDPNQPEAPAGGGYSADGPSLSKPSVSARDAAAMYLWRYVEAQGKAARSKPLNPEFEARVRDMARPVRELDKYERARRLDQSLQQQAEASESLFTERVGDEQINVMLRSARTYNAQVFFVEINPDIGWASQYVPWQQHLTSSMPFKDLPECEYGHVEADTGTCTVYVFFETDTDRIVGVHASPHKASWPDMFAGLKHARPARPNPI